MLSALPKTARVTAQRIHDWVRAGKLAAKRMAGRGKGLLVVALEDVLAVERETRQTTARRGGAKRGRAQAATVLA